MSLFARLRLAPLFLLAALACCMPLRGSYAADAAAGPGAALRDATYDGKWSGKVKCLYDPQMWPDDECDVGFEFVIDGRQMTVKQSIRSKKGAVSSSDIAPLNLKRMSTNAVAFSMHSGDDEDGTWVETVTFVMTLKDPDHLIVHWTRVVNNTDLPAAKKGSKFSSVGMGEMVRSR